LIPGGVDGLAEVIHCGVRLGEELS
jgi:hypothetical protein